MTKTKTTIVLEVDGFMNVTDEGYLGPEATVREHIDSARRNAENWRWFVKKGGTEPEEIHLKVIVRQVLITPGDDSA